MKFTNRELLEAQQALGKLNQVKLPVKVSLDIAFASNTIDKQVKAFALVREKLMKEYSIRPEKVGDGDLFMFRSTEGKKELDALYSADLKAYTDEAKAAEIKQKQADNLTKFNEEFNELVSAESEDITIKAIKLPADAQIEPAVLIPLISFIEV